MTWIIHRPNIYDPSKDLPSYVGNCNSVREALVARFGTDTFDLPTYVTVNRVPTLRKHWDDRLPANSTLEVITVPGAMAGTALTYIMYAYFAITAIDAAFMIYNSSKGYISENVGANVPKPSPVFTFAGQKNIRRLNNPVECVFGKLRWWPSYLCTPRVEYVNNKAIMHLWLSLGQGNFELEDVRVNDTSLISIPEATYTQQDFGHTITEDDDFDIVNYAEDFSNTELLGTNEEGYAILGPFQLNPANSPAEQIMINFSYPAGLFGINTTGDLVERSVTTKIFVLELDNLGVETGKIAEFSYTHTAASTTPQRITETIILSLPWYEIAFGWTGNERFAIRAVRTNAKDTSTNAQDRCLIESVYSCGRSLKTYNVSTLHVILPGTSVIDNSAAEKVNVVATRKLPTIVEGAVTSEQYPTRSVVLAALEILRTSANVPDADLDLDYWASLLDTLTDKTFDFNFETSSTVWSALEAMGLCVNAKPYYIGTDIRFSCDSPIKQPVLMLTADHTSDFSLSMEFKTEMENDCIEAAYVDPDTGLQDSVFFTPPGSEAKNPTKITFAGCTDRQEAWRLAAYTYLKQSLVRDRVSMSVSQDGKIPLLGEIVLLSVPLPSWTDAGLVDSYVATETGAALGLSEAVPFASGWIALRRSNGTVYGPIQFTATEGSFEVALSAELSELFDFTGETKDYVAYTISSNTVITKKFEVERAVPSKDGVKLELVEFNPDVFAYNNLSVPDRGDDMLPYPVANGPVPWIRVLDESGQFLKIERGPIYGEPASVVCKYIWVETDCLDYPSLASSPWGFLDDGIVYPMLEADAVGNSFYIERQNKDLYIKFVVAYGASTFATWWRGRIGEFGLGLSIPLHIWIKNNCDNGYAAPESPSNESSPNAQGVSFVAGGGSLGNAVFDVAERKIEIQVDAPPDCPVYIKLTSETTTASITKTLTKVSKDGGVVVFTERDLETAGCLILDPAIATTTYPIVKIEVWREGESASAAGCYLDIQPLVSTTVEQFVSFKWVSPANCVGIFTSAGTGGYKTLNYYITDSFIFTLDKAYSGAVSFAWEFSQQRSDGIFAATTQPVISKTTTVTRNIIRYPHFHTITYKNLPYEGFGFSGIACYGNLANGEMHTFHPTWWRVAAFGADFLQKLPDVVLVIMTIPEVDLRTLIRDTVAHDIYMMVDDLDLGNFRELTTAEKTQLSQTAYIVAYEEPTFKHQVETAVPFGGARATMRDMFGHNGNVTEWARPTF